MGTVYRPTMPNGKPSPRWYCRWQVAGKTRRRAIGTRAAALAALAKFEDAESRRRHGLPDHAAESAALGKPLALHLADYLAWLGSRDTSDEYRANTRAQLTSLISDLGWVTFADVDADALSRHLGRLRDKPRPRRIVGAARKAGGPTHAEKLPAKGLSPTTLNGHLRAAGAFARWVAKRVKAPDPLAGMEPYPEDVDRRRSRRILTDAELGKLLAATAAARHRPNAAVRGADRAWLYRLAAYTGLRAGELAELTPLHFRLDAAPPVVTVGARDSKGKREEPVPLPAHLLPRLRDWLAGRDPAAKLFPGAWADRKHESRWLAWDLRRAGVDARDAEGRPASFHGLKRRYVVRLLQSGAKVHEIRRLARHADVKTTLKYYTDENLPELGALADRLPPVE